MIHYNTAFTGMTKEKIQKWIMLCKNVLIGSAVFTKNDKSLISKLISWTCAENKKNIAFTPSHVGSLIQIGGQIYIFDMKPPKATIRRFDDYLINTKDEFLLVMRDFELNTEDFSVGICSRLNQKYGYISAIQSAFKYLWWGLREHCSEVHLKELQKQNLFTENDANETTPEDLLNILLGKKGAKVE